MPSFKPRRGNSSTMVLYSSGVRCPPKACSGPPKSARIPYDVAATSGSLNIAIDVVVCNATASQTSCSRCESHSSPAPSRLRKSLAAMAPSTSKRFSLLMSSPVVSQPRSCRIAAIEWTSRSRLYSCLRVSFIIFGWMLSYETCLLSRSLP